MPETERREIISLARAWAAAHHWGLSDDDLTLFADLHRAARESGKDQILIFVEEILTECNFHRENHLLQGGQYDLLREELQAPLF